MGLAGTSLVKVCLVVVLDITANVGLVTYIFLSRFNFCFINVGCSICFGFASFVLVGFTKELLTLLTLKAEAGLQRIKDCLALVVVVSISGTVSVVLVTSVSTGVFSVVVVDLRFFLNGLSLVLVYQIFLYLFRLTTYVCVVVLTVDVVVALGLNLIL